MLRTIRHYAIMVSSLLFRYVTVFNAADVGKKEGTRFRTTQPSRTIVCRFLFLLLLSLSLTSSLLPSFCISILPRCLSFSLSLFPPLASFCFSLFATRRCVWSVVAAARVDSLITLSSSSGPLSLPLHLVLRAPSRPRCRRGKRVKRYRRSRARSANRLL